MAPWRVSHQTVRDSRWSWAGKQIANWSSLTLTGERTSELFCRNNSRAADPYCPSTIRSDGNLAICRRLKTRNRPRRLEVPRILILFSNGIAADPDDGLSAHLGQLLVLCARASRMVDSRSRATHWTISHSRSRTRFHPRSACGAGDLAGLAGGLAAAAIHSSNLVVPAAPRGHHENWSPGARRPPS